MRLRKTDGLFRKLVLKRDNFTCQRCGTTYPEDNCRGLHVSHYWGRGRENTRFDFDNCVCLCYGCHLIWGHGDGRPEYEAFMRHKLGQQRYDLLELRAHIHKGRDDKSDALIIREILRQKDYIGK